jgi:hypothetical protein
MKGVLRRRIWLGFAGVGVPTAIACGCGSSSGPHVDQGSTSFDSGLLAVDASDSGSSGDDSTVDGEGADGGSADSGQDATSGDGGEAGTKDGGPRPEDGAPPSISACNPASTWSSLARVPSIAASGFDRFGAVSAEATTVAWTTSAGAIYVADRASAQADFAAPVQLDPGTTQLANGRVALDPLGLKLIATAASGSTFISFLRSSVGAAWAPGSSAEFHTISSVEGGGVFSEPVLSADGLSLFYVLQLGTAAPVFVESSWDVSMKQWAVGTDFLSPEFVMTSASQLRRPTGASSDHLTLFLFDEVLGHERVAYRNTTSQPFDFFVDLPNVPEAAPATDCTVLYFHGSDASGQGLFTAQ